MMTRLLKQRLVAEGECCGSDETNTSVMPGLVPGIQLYTCSGARFAVDPGNKCRDDMESGHAYWLIFAGTTRYA